MGGVRTEASDAGTQKRGSLSGVKVLGDGDDRLCAEDRVLGVPAVSGNACRFESEFEKKSC